MARSQNLKCQQCEYSFDHTGVAIGMGDPRCWELTPDILNTECNLQLLAGQQAFCKTELVADWLMNGMMEFKVKRSCDKYVPPVPTDKCNEGNSGLFYYRDCYTFCDTDNCNDKSQNAAVIDLSSKKDPQSNEPRKQSCLSCNTRNGDDVATCRMNPSSLPNGVMDCPAYANYGCFNANKFPVDMMPCVGDNCVGNPGQEQYSKGCSPFLFTEANNEIASTASRCDHVVSDGASYESCKKTCDTENCNIGAVLYSPSCYTCSVTVDHTGAPMGWGDTECIEGALERHIEQCGPNQDVCVAEMELDWRPSGIQTTTVRRGCGSSSDLDQQVDSVVCSSTSTSAFRSKTCTKECSPPIGTEPCNKDLEGISDLFAGNIVQQCRSCSSAEDVKPDENGVLHDCAEDPTMVRVCPDYLTMSCFSSRSQNTVDNPGAPMSLSAHGCSGFTQDFPVCTEFDTTGTIDPDGGIHGGDEEEKHLRVCKQTCGNDECNDYVVDVPPANTKMCYQCQVTFNNFGAMVICKI